MLRFALLPFLALLAASTVAYADPATPDTAGLTADPSHWAMYGLAAAGLLYRKLRPAR